MSDWANWKDGLKSYGEFTDAFLGHAGPDREMDEGEFANFMKTLGVKDGSFAAVPQKDSNKTISAAELVGRGHQVDLRDKSDSDGVFNRAEMEAFFTADKSEDPGTGGPGAGGSLRFADVNKDASGIDAMFVSKDELKSFMMKAAGSDNKLNGDEIKALAKSTGADPSLLAGLDASKDGYVDASEIDKAFSAADQKGGGDDDGQMNADELYSFFGVTPPADGGSGSNGFGYGAVDQNGDGVTADEIYARMSALSPPGSDGKWNGDETQDLSSKTGVGLDKLTSIANQGGADGYLSKDDIAAAVLKIAPNGKLTEAQFTQMFGTPGTGGGPATQEMSADDLYSQMAAALSPGSDGKWNGNEVKDLATKIGADATALAAIANQGARDGFLTKEDLAAAVLKADADGKLNAGQIAQLLGLSAGTTGGSTTQGGGGTKGGTGGTTGTQGGGSNGTGGTGGTGSTGKGGNDTGGTSSGGGTGRMFDANALFAELGTERTPGSDGKWDSKEITELAAAAKIDENVLRAIADESASDGFLTIDDLRAAIAVIDKDGMLNEAQVNKLFGLPGGSATGSNTQTSSKDGGSSKGGSGGGNDGTTYNANEIFTQLSVAMTPGNDIKYGSEEITGLAIKSKVSENVLRSIADAGAKDGFLTVADVQAAVAAIDKDGELNRSQVTQMLGGTDIYERSGPGGTNHDNLRAEPTNTRSTGNTTTGTGGNNGNGTTGTGNGGTVTTGTGTTGTGGTGGNTTTNNGTGTTGGTGTNTGQSTTGGTGTTTTGNGTTGTGTGGATSTSSGFSFASVNRDESGIESMFVSTGEIFDHLIGTNTHGGDYVWSGDAEMKALADTLKVDVAGLQSAAGADKSLDVADLANVVATLDGQGADNLLNADQLPNLFKAQASS